MTAVTLGYRGLLGDQTYSWLNFLSPGGRAGVGGLFSVLNLLSQHLPFLSLLPGLDQHSKMKPFLYDICPLPPSGRKELMD